MSKFGIKSAAKLLKNCESMNFIHNLTKWSVICKFWYIACENWVLTLKVIAARVKKLKYVWFCEQPALIDGFLTMIYYEN